MKTIAIIIAGGVGKRVGADIPKQFIEIEGKPILIYTLEAFDKYDAIDEIEVVCIESWIDELKKMISFYNLKKIKYIVPGGNNYSNCFHYLISDKILHVFIKAS